MWMNIALMCCLSGICSVLFIKLSHMYFEPETETPIAVKAIGVIWLLLSAFVLAVSALFLIWQ